MPAHCMQQELRLRLWIVTVAQWMYAGGLCCLPLDYVVGYNGKVSLPGFSPIRVCLFVFVFLPKSFKSLSSWMKSKSCHLEATRWQHKQQMVASFWVALPMHQGAEIGQRFPVRLPVGSPYNLPHAWVKCHLRCPDTRVFSCCQPWLSKLASGSYPRVLPSNPQPPACSSLSKLQWDPGGPLKNTL